MTKYSALLDRAIAAIVVAGLYREVQRTLIPSPARVGERLRDQLDRLGQVRALGNADGRREAVQPQGGGESRLARK